MASLVSLIIIGISLSMDAFSLSLAYGMTGLSKKQKIAFPIVVAIYHFIMPLIGLQFGLLITKLNFININLMASIILIYLGFDLIVSNFKEKEPIVLSKISILFFGMSVSLDSLTLGIGLNAITDNYLLSSVIFSLCSGLFTYLGLILGNIIGSGIGPYSKMVGGIILITIAIIIFIK